MQHLSANLPPLKLLTKGLDENAPDGTPEEKLLQGDDVDPFEDLAVDDEDYNPSLESEEDEDDKEVTTTVK